MKLNPSGSETEAALEPCAKEQCEAEREKLMAEKEAQQQEIERLQKVLAEKDALIRSQQARQQDQAKTLQEASSQAAHAQIKLRRLATRPAAASTIAEAEISVESLKSSPATHTEQFLQTQAQRLLAAATASYAEDNYAAAMDQAAQAREFIDMVKNNRIRKAPGRTTVSLQTPLPLRVIADSNLRQKPGLKSAVLGILKKDSTMTAEAYHGDWLQVQTADGHSGWVLNTLVEAQAGKP
ncbi:MAG TPA: SH3 domain-containing protein [Nitrosospira sp.]|jgi:chromosome segregation ATPase